ncbi:MAG: hypothetical protein D6796_16945, partial [Caldilineae bacterium]
GLTVYGRLTALGTAAQPITFTATTPQPDWWDGIHIEGTMQSPNTGSAFEYVTIEYAGWRYPYGNLNLQHAQATLEHSILRYSGGDGLHAEEGGIATIAVSQIYSNTGYGAQTGGSGEIMAANNWWGSPTGPRADNNCNPGGTGDRVGGNVFYKPFLTSPDADPGPLSPADARILRLTPLRWFIPADGVSRAWVLITLLDGNGQPLPGRTVRLTSTLGDVTDGGLTDAQGQTYAFVTSNTPGDATLTPSLDAVSCEAARGTSATVTFTPFDTAADLFPDAMAPYATGGIAVSPMPIVRGVTTTLRVNLTNPNDFPIRVNGTFGFAQSGIGLPFGPLGDVQDVQIPAQGSKTISLTWTPVVAGHYCAQFEYAWAPVTTTTRLAQWHSGHAQRNLSVFQGPLNKPGDKEILNKARTATGLVGKMGADKGATFIPKFLAQKLVGWQLDKAAEISQALGGDPPRQDYTTIAMPDKPSVPPFTPDANLSAARADALNALVDALLDVQAFGEAATLTLDRYAGAAAADDLTWTSQQAAALLYYERQLGTALITASLRLDDFLQVLENEGESDVFITAADLTAYQDRLRTQGFNSDELDAAHLLGLTDAEIEAYRQQKIAADPNAETGSLKTYLTDLSAYFRRLGEILTGLQNFPTVTTGRTAGGATFAGPNRLARVYESAAEIGVGNPLTHTATISLAVRRVDMPDDWLASVTPRAVTLAPGETTTVTVRVSPGSATVQGTRARIAVEGYAGGQLIGGVVHDVLVPQAAFFDGSLHLYLPLVLKP